MRKIIIILLTVVLMLPGFAAALSLDEAKAQGLIGETTSGYLEAVSPAAGPEVAALVQDINGKRRVKYVEIAKENGTPLEAVEALAGKKAIEKSGAGERVKVNGRWLKK